MLAELLGLVVPPRCAVCGRECGLRDELCERCESGLGGLAPCSTAIPGLDATWSAAPYEGVARDLVVALKFGGRLPLARRAGAEIAERAPAGLLEGVIVPVPPAPARRRWRGFDAAEAIAAALSVETGLPLGLCLRRSQGRRQVGRPRSERLAAPPQVRLAAPPPAAAVLVDDVVTTGATIGACARALRSGGSGRIVSLTFARSGSAATRSRAPGWRA
jgi:predicted amidophosphoribosyltransferase